MSCIYCKATIGKNYPFFETVPCAYCKTGIFVDSMGTYVGMEDSLHLFRVHPKYICPGCGQGLFIIEIHCEEGHDVTAEFVKLSLSEGVKK